LTSINQCTFLSLFFCDNYFAGWVATDGLELAYGESKSYLEPLRSLWEGTEGILWLLSVPNATAAAAASGGGGTAALVPGAFYLDRSPQPKHIAGPFFSEGSFTKNTPAEVQDMMAQLQAWSSAATRPYKPYTKMLAARKHPLVCSDIPLELALFVGNWHILAHIPSSWEKDASNCMERYVLDEIHGHINITCSYIAERGIFRQLLPNELKMRGNVMNPPFNTQWSVDPRIGQVSMPFGLSFLILHVAPDYSYALAGVPDRSCLWVMVRSTPSEHTAAGVAVLDCYPELRSLCAFARPPAPSPFGDGTNDTNSSTTINSHNAFDAAAEPGELHALATLGYAKTTTTNEADPLISDQTASGADDARVDPADPNRDSSATFNKSGAVNGSTSTSVTGADTDAGADMEMSRKVLAVKRVQELLVLQAVCPIAQEQGYDIHSILRCPWRNGLVQYL
jgi:lipocalin